MTSKVFDVTKRGMEIDAYHGLGFYISYHTLIETDRGYKGEERDPTDIEESLFERFAAKTPEIPTFFIDGDAEDPLEVMKIDGIQDLQCFWVASHEDYKTWKHMVLWAWEPCYHNMNEKELRKRGDWFDV